MKFIVKQLGGNQYRVTDKKGKSEIVDLDGFTIMTDKEYLELMQYEKATGKSIIQDEMLSLEWAEESGLFNAFELAALEHAANYSGFLAADYIKGFEG